MNTLKVGFLFNTILLAASFYLFFVSLKDFFKNKTRNFSQNMAHFGFSLLILSILFNNFLSKEVITNLKIGESFQSKDLKISFVSLSQNTKNNYESLVGKFNIENLNGDTEILYPELRIYNQPNIVTSEADIKMSLWSDRFITMNYVNNQDYFNIRYQFKPFMIWIWISTLIISLGGLISLFKKYES